MEKNQTRLHGTQKWYKIWINIYNKPTNSKRYVLFTSNHPRHCLTNTPFSLARRIRTAVENERFKELKRTLLEQKYSKSLIEATILRAKEISIEILRQPETAKNEEITSFLHTIPTIQTFLL